eukprot:jgi/Pico_ML_1/53808/g4284.t1
MARTYLPSRVPDIVKLWREDVKTINAKAAESLADPAEYPNLFQGYDSALQIEEQLKAKRRDAVNGTRNEEYSDADEEAEDVEHSDAVPADLEDTVAISENPIQEDPTEDPSMEDTAEDFGSVEVEPSDGIGEELIEEDIPADVDVTEAKAAVDQYAEDNFEAAMEEMVGVDDEGAGFDKADSPIFGGEDTYDEDLDDDWGLDEEVESKQD